MKSCGPPCTGHKEEMGKTRGKHSRERKKGLLIGKQFVSIRGVDELRLTRWEVATVVDTYEAYPTIFHIRLGRL